MFAGKTVVLGICGGIAAYKAATLCSQLVQAGAHVKVIMTERATKFITPLTLQTLSRNPVYVDTFDEFEPEVVSHIAVADAADVVIVAPTTANMIAKLAHGIADDMLSTTLLATTAPIFIAPAMNVHMYEHPATVSNMAILAERGVHFIEPGSGQLACGYVGKGRLAEPHEIVAHVSQWWRTRALLQGKNMLITAGGTIERIDPVRYVTNDSSGKMGFAIAEVAKQMGANVTVVAARTTAQVPQGINLVRVESAAQMYEAVVSRYDGMDIVVKAAAVADYRPVNPATQKVKKTDDQLTITLEKTTDILQTLGKQKQHQFLVGFAAETNDVERYALDKLQRKNCDLMVANDVSQAGVGFHGDTNAVSIFDRHGLVQHISLTGKTEVAAQLLTLIAARMSQHDGATQ